MTEAVVQRRSIKKVLIKNFAKFTEKKLCLRLSFSNFIKKRLWHRSFSVKFAKFSRTLFYETPLHNCFSDDEAAGVNWMDDFPLQFISRIISDYSFHLFFYYSQNNMGTNTCIWCTDLSGIYFHHHLHHVLFQSTGLTMKCMSKRTIPKHTLNLKKKSEKVYCSWEGFPEIL